MVASSRNSDSLRLKLVKSWSVQNSKRASVRIEPRTKKIGAAPPYRSSFPGSLTPDSETTLHGSVKVSLDKSLSSDSRRGHFHKGDRLEETGQIQQGLTSAGSEFALPKCISTCSRRAIGAAENNALIQLFVLSINPFVPTGTSHRSTRSHPTDSTTNQAPISREA